MTHPTAKSFTKTFAKTFFKSFAPARLALATTLLLGSPAAAQQVSPCDWRSSAANLVEPWAENSRTFANGAVRLAVLDTIEPGAAAFNILVLSPPFDELGGRQCRIVSLDTGIGFTAASLDGMTAEYDPATGLLISLPVGLYDTATGGSLPTRLRITLNQATGALAADLR